MSRSRSRLVVLFCGIPGCGKTTFIQQYSDYLRKNFGVEEERLHIISYDKLLNEITWDDNSFHRVREESESILTELLSSTLNSQRIVIIDDNMYLRSMRREIYVICRNMHVPLLTVWIQTDPEIAFQRNQFRNQFQNGNVSIESFQRINSDFQPPDSKFVFDRNFLKFSGETGFNFESFQTLYDTSLHLIENHDQKMKHLELISQQQKTSLSHVTSGESFIKFMDDTYRKLITELISQFRELLASKSFPAEAQNLMKMVGKLLADMKSQCLSTIRKEKKYHIFVQNSTEEKICLDQDEDCKFQLQQEYQQLFLSLSLEQICSLVEDKELLDAIYDLVHQYQYP